MAKAVIWAIFHVKSSRVGRTSNSSSSEGIDETHEDVLDQIDDLRKHISDASTNSSFRDDVVRRRGCWGRAPIPVHGSTTVARSANLRFVRGALFQKSHDAARASALVDLANVVLVQVIPHKATRASNITVLGASRTVCGDSGRALAHIDHATTPDHGEARV